MYTNANLFMLAPTPAPMASSAYYYATGNSSLYNKDRPVPTMSVPIPSHPIYAYAQYAQQYQHQYQHQHHQHYAHHHQHQAHSAPAAPADSLRQQRTIEIIALEEVPAPLPSSTSRRHHHHRRHAQSQRPRAQPPHYHHHHQQDTRASVPASSSAASSSTCTSSDEDDDDEEEYDEEEEEEDEEGGESYCSSEEDESERMRTEVSLRARMRRIEAWRSAYAKAVGAELGSSLCLLSFVCVSGQLGLIFFLLSSLHICTQQRHPRRAQPRNAKADAAMTRMTTTYVPSPPYTHPPYLPQHTPINHN